MRVTLDASVTLKWFLRTPAEADLRQATALLRAIEADEIRLIQPPHALAEVAAVLVRERPATATPTSRASSTAAPVPVP